MPHYYFCVQHGSSISDENDFVELPGNEAAWTKATTDCGEAINALDESAADGAEWRVDVQDAFRRPLYTLRVTSEKFQ